MFLSINTCMLRLRDDQWERIQEHFPEEHIPESRAGRKPVPTRAVLEAVLRILNTGAPWPLLPPCDPQRQDGASPLSAMVPTRSAARDPDAVGQYAA